MSLIEEQIQNFMFFITDQNIKLMTKDTKANSQSKQIGEQRV